MIYLVVEKVRNIQYGDASDYMLKLVELGNFHKPNGEVFELASNRGGRLQISHWSGPSSSFFIDRYSDFVLIDGTHKNDIYDLSLVVITVVDSLGVSIPTGFIVTSSENSSSIESHLDLLRVGGNSSPNLSRNTSYSIMTDEGSALIKVAPSMWGCNHCLFSFHVNQLAVRVSLWI